MIRSSLALVLIATPAAAAPHGPGCRLSTSECIQVAREIAAEQVQQDEDRRIFGLTMRPYDRAVELIKRHYARMSAREHHLPVKIANEWSRLNLCAVKDARAAEDGTENTESACR